MPKLQHAKKIAEHKYKFFLAQNTELKSLLFFIQNIHKKYHSAYIKSIQSELVPKIQSFW